MRTNMNLLFTCCETEPSVARVMRAAFWGASARCDGRSLAKVVPLRIPASSPPSPFARADA